MWGGLVRVVTMGDPVGVDPRPALAALGDGTHDDHLGPLQVARGRPAARKVRGTRRSAPHQLLTENRSWNLLWELDPIAESGLRR
jgi:hypothetical protein